MAQSGCVLPACRQQLRTNLAIFLDFIISILGMILCMRDWYFWQKRSLGARSRSFENLGQNGQMKKCTLTDSDLVTFEKANQLIAGRVRSLEFANPNIITIESFIAPGFRIENYPKLSYIRTHSLDQYKLGSWYYIVIEPSNQIADFVVCVEEILAVSASPFVISMVESVVANPPNITRVYTNYEIVFFALLFFLFGLLFRTRLGNSP